MTRDPVFWANESLRVAFGQRDLDAFDGNTRAKYSVPLYTKPPDQAEIGREQRIMKVAHTPGPWLIEPTDTSKAIVTDDCVICEMAPWDDEYQDELEANARLIAAAPDLLEACRRFSGVMNLLGYENDPTAEFGRAAIEKATGVSSDQG